ncbi:PLP-dependent transferase [Phytohabitans sp. ZYX-F-186]|uniref:PLP-dependent transferase n=1 Tax=Phytohabitans maris TaxID=3071409 RepID=A0ABU0ZRA0_9ACTN|nr:PLP-dependent transferase [Phytohabitans sp. ZYX-F-186]MDQ7908750.1 PLP-dependent transferase [Phytohabitans sp. ZYX-F-186]
MQAKEPQSLATTVAQWDGHRDHDYGSVVNPIYLTTTYDQSRQPADGARPFDYSRTSNPNRVDLEDILGRLEGGMACLYSSGMAAVHAAFQAVCTNASHVVLPHDAYSGTLRLVLEELARFGVTHSLIDMSDVALVEREVTNATTLIWVEHPTNPGLRSVDVRSIAGIKKGAVLAVDNTIATPVYQRPLELGADLVVHSTSKYLSGHSDVIGGCVVTSSSELNARLHVIQNSFGSVPSPVDCFLTGRGLKTLHLRMSAHTRSAAAVTAFLESVEGISDVNWPGFSGMVSFRCPSADALADALTLFRSATSLGGVESLVKVPWSMSGNMMGAAFKAYPADTVRLSCGIEDPDDLVRDLDRAFNLIGLTKRHRTAARPTPEAHS